MLASEIEDVESFQVFSLQITKNLVNSIKKLADRIVKLQFVMPRYSTLMHF